MMVIWIQLGGSHLPALSAREVALLLFQLLKIKGEGSSSELNCFRWSESSFPVASMPFGCHACLSGGGGGHDYQPDNQLHSRLPTPPHPLLCSDQTPAQQRKWQHQAMVTKPEFVPKDRPRPRETRRQRSSCLISTLQRWGWVQRSSIDNHFNMGAGGGSFATSQTLASMKLSQYEWSGSNQTCIHLCSALLFFLFLK